MLGRLTRRIWLRTSLIGLLGIGAAILAAVVERYIPWDLPGQIAADAVGGLLNIIASSMLAVTTFSLSVMTAAYGSATSNVTPRATTLLIEDRVTQNALSAFVGSFLFAIVGLIVLPTGAYGERGRVVLFVFTIAIIGLIVVSLLRWIDHLTSLGQVGETTARVENSARTAIETRKADPLFGCRPLPTELPKGVPVIAGQVGYLQHIDTAALQDIAEDLDTEIFIPVLPGAFIFQTSALCQSASALPEEAVTLIRRAFTIGEDRTFDQDPRFGLVVMSEIALRALSPGINDPGTAIAVIGRTTRLLTLWAGPEHRDVARFPRLYIAAVTDADMLEDAFMLLAREGAAQIEVQLRLMKSLRALGTIGEAAFRRAVRQQALLSAERAQAALPLDAERRRIRDLADEVAR